MSNQKMIYIIACVGIVMMVLLMDELNVKGKDLLDFFKGKCIELIFLKIRKRVIALRRSNVNLKIRLGEKFQLIYIKTVKRVVFKVIFIKK